MNQQNYIDAVFKSSINIMRGNTWQWPDSWDTARKLQFLHNSLLYAKQYEFWEEAAIIRDVRESIEKETGSLPSNSEQ